MSAAASMAALLPFLKFLAENVDAETTAEVTELARRFVKANIARELADVDAEIDRKFRSGG